jgi:hypothetical protein
VNSLADRPRKQLFAANHAFAAALVTAAILAIPLVAMQFSREVKWSAGDFIVAGALIFGTAYVFQVAMTRVPRYRLAVGAAILLLFAWVWVELAVGLFTGIGS